MGDKKNNCSGPQAFKSQRVAYQSNQKLRIIVTINAFGKGYLCLLKRFLFLSIHRLYFIYFLQEIYMEKVLQEILWVPILFKRYQNTSGCGTVN